MTKRDKRQINYISNTFKLCNTILGSFYHAFFISIWNVGDISTAHLIIMLVSMTGRGKKFRTRHRQQKLHHWVLGSLWLLTDLRRSRLATDNSLFHHPKSMFPIDIFSDLVFAMKVSTEDDTTASSSMPSMYLCIITTIIIYVITNQSLKHAHTRAHTQPRR